MKLILRLALIAAIVATAFVTRADILYGMNSGILTRIDTDTLTATPIGDTGIFAVSGLEFGPDGQLYGLAPDTNELIKVDINTGEAFVVGSTILNISRGSGMGWDPTTNQMYTVAKLGSTPDILVTVSLDTGSTTAITSISGIANFKISGLDFTTSGELYGVRGGSPQQLLNIDKTNGNTTLIGTAALPPIGSLTISPISGIAWTVTPPGELYSVDLENGVATNHGLLTGIVNGPAGISALASIPSSSVITTFCAGILLSVRRRRRSNLNGTRA